MSQLTNPGENSVLDLLFAGAARVTTWHANYLKVVTDGEVPTVTETGVVARKALAADGTIFSVTAGTASNDAQIDWPAPSATDDADVTHIGLWDASSGGQLWAITPLASAFRINDGGPPYIAAGALTFTGLPHRLLEVMFTNGSTIPANWGMAMMHDATTETGVAGYSRQSVSATTGFTVAADSASPAADIIFASPTANDTADITHVGFYDAAGGGNLWFTVPVNPFRINAGAPLKIADTLTISAA